MSFINRIWTFFLRLFASRRRTSFSEIEFVAPSDITRLTKAGKLVLIGTPQKQKWVKFLCPCGCGEEQALNLMPTHYPCWTIKLHQDSTLTINPSVDAKKCGAHFWVRRNQIEWVN